MMSYDDVFDDEEEEGVENYPRQLTDPSPHTGLPQRKVPTGCIATSLCL